MLVEPAGDLVGLLRLLPGAVVAVLLLHLLDLRVGVFLRVVAVDLEEADHADVLVEEDMAVDRELAGVVGQEHPELGVLEVEHDGIVPVADGEVALVGGADGVVRGDLVDLHRVDVEVGGVLLEALGVKFHDVAERERRVVVEGLRQDVGLVEGEDPLVDRQGVLVLDGADLGVPQRRDGVVQGERDHVAFRNPAEVLEVARHRGRPDRDGVDALLGLFAAGVRDDVEVEDAAVLLEGLDLLRVGDLLEVRLVALRVSPLGFGGLVRGDPAVGPRLRAHDEEVRPAAGKEDRRVVAPRKVLREVDAVLGDESRLADVVDLEVHVEEGRRVEGANPGPLVHDELQPRHAMTVHEGQRPEGEHRANGLLLLLCLLDGGVGGVDDELGARASEVGVEVRVAVHAVRRAREGREVEAIQRREREIPRHRRPPGPELVARDIDVVVAPPHGHLEDAVEGHREDVQKNFRERSDLLRHVALLLRDEQDSLHAAGGLHRRRPVLVGMIPMNSGHVVVLDRIDVGPLLAGMDLG
mmetsp:Transcript_3626/g.11932  ORF Transcript_3626/g.11932 Transcript_3626/m.11932 type:complete len:526 (-) Transcript_3626:646-2223(-)